MGWNHLWVWNQQTLLFLESIASENIFSYCIMDKQILDEVVGVCKRLIWDVKDLRYDVSQNDKQSHFIEKMRSLNDFQRIIIVHGLKNGDPFYKLCELGSKCLTKCKAKRYKKRLTEQLMRGHTFTEKRIEEMLLLMHVAVDAMEGEPIIIVQLKEAITALEKLQIKDVTKELRDVKGELSKRKGSVSQTKTEKENAMEYKKELLVKATSSLIDADKEVKTQQGELDAAKIKLANAKGKQTKFAAQYDVTKEEDDVKKASDKLKVAKTAFESATKDALAAEAAFEKERKSFQRLEYCERKLGEIVTNLTTLDEPLTSYKYIGSSDALFHRNNDIVMSILRAVDENGIMHVKR
jgi:hypothetical protein